MVRSAPSRHHRTRGAVRSTDPVYEVHTIYTDPEHGEYEWNKMRTNLTHQGAQKLAKSWAEDDELAIVRRSDKQYDEMFDADEHYVHKAKVSKHDAERWAEGDVID